MPAFIIALAFLLTVIAGGGIALASQGALPGESLIPVKLTVQEFRTALVASDEANRQAGTEKAAKRVDEARSRSGVQTASATSNITGTLAVTPTVTVKRNPHVAKGRPTVTISGTLGITLTNTISDVIGLVDDLEVPGESENGLLAKLQAAQGAIGRGRVKVAVNNLGAFLNQLNAMQQSGHISSSNYDALYARYSAIVEGLGGTPDAAATPVLLPSSEATPEAEQPAVAPERGRRPDKNAQRGKKQLQPNDSDDEVIPTTEASPAPNASRPKAKKPAAGREPGSDHPAAPSSPGKSGNRK